MNSILINNYTFPDGQIINGNVLLANSMISDELSADEANFDVLYVEQATNDVLVSAIGDVLISSEGDTLISNNPSASIDLDTLPYGTPIIYSHNGNIVGKFYTTEIRQTGKNRWKISAQSAIGLLIRQEHNGGVYAPENGDTIKSVIDEIMAGLNIPYTVSDAIKDQAVAGWLPVASCRDNLQQLCFAFGISVLKDANGDIVFDFNEPDTPEAGLVDSNIYVGGYRTKVMPITRAVVYEHAYYAIDTQPSVVVFDNTGEASATNQKIIFDNPVIVSTITTTGTITISESGANYAIVSGLGTIEAVEYTHTVKVLEQATGATSIENKEQIIKEATLVNALNSTNCLKRVAYYYSQANEVNYDIVAETERTGELVAYPDPFTDEPKTGLIKAMQIAVSGILKASAKLTDNWLPDYLGNNYSDYELLTDGASWTADRTGTVRFVLCGGGQGGQAGQKGENGTSYEVGSSSGYGYGGAGGAGGNGGGAGKVLVVDVAVTQGTTYTFILGTGGSGGASNGALGTEGTATEITIGGTTYSSADGASPLYGYVNTLTGNIYAMQGGIGHEGAYGGDYGQAGQDLTYNGVTYTGGAGGPAGSEGGGGGGGGASVGANGQNGHDGGSHWEGQGGNGGSATPATGNAGIGGGGNGGHGGGGGGGGGANHYWPAGGGSGGAGGTGATGADGFILIYK